MQAPTIEKRIIEYFQQFATKQVDCNTAINIETGICVSEFEDIVRFFKEEFNVDLEPMDTSRYFEDEAMTIKEIFDYWFCKKTKTPKEPLTINHLIEVVEKGEWFEPKG
jgi:hypothetical protein